MTRQKPARNFRKLRSFTLAQQEKALKQWERDVQKCIYSEDPPRGSTYGGIGRFRWPKNIDRTALGGRLERLDQLRLDHSCWILNGADKIEVLGNVDDVRDALIRIRKTFQQIEALTMVATPLYVLRPSASGYVPVEVMMEQLSKDVDGVAAGATIFKGIDWDMHVDEQADPYGQALDAVMSVVRKLRFMRAHITFKIRLGVFHSKQFLRPKDDTYTFTEFEDMLQEKGFEGDTTETIGDKQREVDALNALKTGGFLIPQDTIVDDDYATPQNASAYNFRKLPQNVSSANGHSRPYNNTSDNVHRPLLTVRFSFDNPGSALQLDLTYQSNGSDHYTLVSKRWTYKPQEPISLLDVHIINPKHGSSWVIDMQASVPAYQSAIPDRLKEFASSVSFRDRDMRHSDYRLPKIEHRPDSSLISIQRCMIFRFDIVDSHFAVELTHLDTNFFNTRYAPPMARTGPHWSLTVVNDEWSKMLVTNENLAVGEETSYPIDVATWFRAKSTAADRHPNGFRRLTKDLQRIEDLVWEDEVDDYTGMQVG